jgi:hypothetical protein
MISPAVVLNIILPNEVITIFTLLLLESDAALKNA